MTMEAPPNEPSVSEALAQIQAILAEIMAMGANDSERESIEAVTREVAAQAISPTEGINAARSIRDAKQAYH